MRRFLEVLFGHKRLMLGPLVAVLIATGAYIAVQPKNYQSSATLWANGGTVGTQSAAQAQSDIISQYLKTNSFAVAVVQGGPVGDYLNQHPAAVQGGFSTPLTGIFGGSSGKPSADQLRQYLAAHLTVAQLGPSELTLTVSGPTPDVAKATAIALITQLSQAEVAARTAAGQAQLALYQSQLIDQQKALGADLAAVESYLAAHPNLANNSAAASADAQLAVLQDAASVARQTYVSLLGKIAQTSSDLALAQQPSLAPFRVVDAPQTPSAPALGRQELIALAAGLLAGLLLMLGIGALLVRLDTTIHGLDEVPGMVGLTVIGSTPLSAVA